MKARLTSSQSHGQATVEALLMIVFGFLLVLGIHHLGQLRSSTLDLLGESHFLSFTPQRVKDGLDANVRLGDSTYSSIQLELENQLGFDSATMLRASAQSAPMQRSTLPTLGLRGQAPLLRHSFLLSGYGQADSTQAAQTKIADSATLWQKSFSQSRQLVNNSAATLQSIDQAWGRTTLTSSWLVPWANESLVPGSRGPALSSQRTQAVYETPGGVLK